MRLIDADALKYRRVEYGGYDDVPMEDRIKGILYLMKKDIDNAPTIEPKRGFWEDVEEILDEGNIGENPYTIMAVGYKCSECGTEMGNLWNFCPNCGAKMNMERSEE